MVKTPDQFLKVGQCCSLDEPYASPVGTYDQPYIYVYDADDLPDGQDRLRANIQTYSGADFVCRRIAGHNRVATAAQFYDVMRRELFDGNFNTAGLAEFGVCGPEMIFPSASGIQFDLIPVAKALNACETPLSQIIFQGARRYKGYPRPPSYPYWEDPWSYTADVTLDFDAGITKRYAIDIFDFDFELLEMFETIMNPTGGGGPAVPGAANQACKVQLYDQVKEQVFSAPILDDLIMSNSSSYQGVCPVPGIVYRIGQQIRFDLTSICNRGDCDIVLQLVFKGVRRRPC